MKYADIIIDISHNEVDRTFEYKVPSELEEKIGIGTVVSIPFGRGNKLRTGYVIGFHDEPEFDEDKLKSIESVLDKSIPAESNLIKLASFMRERYGSTMINALKTVMPVKDKVKGLVKKEINLAVSKEAAEEAIAEYEKKHAVAKARLMRELVLEKTIPYEIVTGKLNISRTTINSLIKDSVIEEKSFGYYRSVVKDEDIKDPDITPTQKQQEIIDEVLSDYENGQRNTYLLKGITGSGKTLVYIEIIDKIVAMGKQAIVLIPEIALTYQTVKRFRNRFKDKVTIINSRLSKGERYDQFMKAKNGDVSVIIGPRSALFAPFENLGIIIIDEEHESTYKSENPPKYHAREVAIERAKQEGAFVLLGSATPSVESYYNAKKGEYKLLTLDERAAENAELAEVSVVDLREELKAGNKTIFSRKLTELIKDRLEKKEQTMLFINRRGYAGFVSCRSCGHVFKCPHCDVSLTIHGKGTASEKMVCHYCGYERPKITKCDECSSPMVAGFGLGTQKVEESIKKMFPQASVLRMDLDTTAGKEGHEKILSKFAEGDADILVGTQMIVKGHDFSNVTLMGIIAADLTMFDNDYKSAERTFDLLTQAAGRAGRGDTPGDVVIQTYQPDHYVIQASAHQDYNEFYEAEKAYRSVLDYPPFVHIMAIFFEGPSYQDVCDVSEKIKGDIMDIAKENKVRVFGPCDATIVKVNDRFRRVIYLKSKDENKIVAIKDYIEKMTEDDKAFDKIYLSFDLDPMHSY